MQENLLVGIKVKLRALEPEDEDILYHWENDSSVWHVSGTSSPFSRKVIREYVENSHYDIYVTRQLRLMIDTLEGVPVGCIDLFEFDPQNLRAGIGILISNQENRGKGYASEALKVLINYVFSTLHLHQLHCMIATDNLNSIQLFEKNGFKECGVVKEWVKLNNKWQDVKFYQLVNKG